MQCANCSKRDGWRDTDWFPVQVATQRYSEGYADLCRRCSKHIARDVEAGRSLPNLKVRSARVQVNRLLRPLGQRLVTRTNDVDGPHFVLDDQNRLIRYKIADLDAFVAYLLFKGENGLPSPKEKFIGKAA